MSVTLSCMMNHSTIKQLFSKIGYIAVIILSILSWCATVPVLAQTSSSLSVSESQEMNLTAEDREAIEALGDSYSKFALAGDFDSWLQLFREDAVRVNPGAAPLEGRDAISQWINGIDMTVLNHNISVTEIEGTRELAYAMGTFQSEISVNLGGGEELIIPDEGTWLAVVRRDEQDNWRFYRFIYNTDLAPPTDASAQNEEALDTYLSVYNTREYDRLDTILAPDFRTGAVNKPALEGPAAFKAYLDQLHTNFEPLHMEGGEIYLSGDIALREWTVTATSPSTGTPIRITGMSQTRFRDGLITENTTYVDPTPLQVDAIAGQQATINVFYSVWNTKDYDSLDAVLAPDFRHGSVDNPIAEGLDAFKAYMSGQVHAFQDVHMDVQHSVVEGDSGATQWTLRVTDPVTGRRITLPGMSILRFQNGQIVEHIPYYNPAPLQED